MNLDSYQILSNCAARVNRDVNNFTAEFTCPDEAFKFQLHSKITGETTVFFVISNDCSVDLARHLEACIMGGLGYKLKSPPKT